MKRAFELHRDLVRFYVTYSVRCTQFRLRFLSHLYIFISSHSFFCQNIKIRLDIHDQYRIVDINKILDQHKSTIKS